MAFDLNKKILIVDDTPAIRIIVTRMLAKKGCTNIIEAEDGKQAWERLEEAHTKGEPVEFVMSDWKMPNLSGICLVKKMKEDKRFEMIPFLMVSAESDDQSVIDAYKAGITSFVGKPFSMQLLDEKIEQIFAA
jgi:two-component system chemotaxis response regulator CheY